MTLLSPPSVLIDASRPTSIVPYGLFSVAPVLPFDRTVAVEWENRVCIHVHETVSDCFTEAVVPDKDLEGDEEWQTALPFTLYTASDCMPDPNDDSEARVTDTLVASEQYGVERHFHLTVLDTASDVIGTGVSATVAVGLLEQELASRYGTPGVIHMNRHLFSVADLRTDKVGGVLRTKLGTAIVAGGGYPADDEMYGTGPIRVYRSAVVSTEALDWVHNRDVNLGERTYAVAADLCSGVIAVTGITAPA